MTDLPPLEACPYDKRGRHHLCAVLPGEDSGDMTLFCEHCGATRRMPASGRLVGDSLDELDADEILRRLQ